MRASFRACALLCTVALGCIPSHRLVHDGDTYFERCYGADYDSRITATQKEACWSAWIAHYTKHQPAHRIDYAMRRIEGIQGGEAAPRLPGFARPEAVSEPVQAELQAAASAADNSGAALLGGVADAAAGPVPNGCLNYCNQYEGACNARCPGTSTACRIGCEHERAVCLNGCH